MTACLGGSGGADLGRRSGFWWPSVVVLAYFLRRTARFSEVSGWLEGREAANQSRGGGAITFRGEGPIGTTYLYSSGSVLVPRFLWITRQVIASPGARPCLECG